MSGTQLIPTLRFSGFLDNWGRKNLIDLSKNGFSNGAFNDQLKVGSGYKLINVKDMYVGSSIDISTLSLLALDEKEFKKNKVSKGDVFFTRSSIVPEGIAFSNIFLDDSEDVTYDGHLIKMAPNPALVNPQFLFYHLKTFTSRKQFISRGKSSTMTTIGQDDIATIKVILPSCKEQQKIADFLSSVDKKISQLKEKHALLQQYKKGVMQQIFTQQIRFKDDKGKAFSDWAETQLSKLLILQEYAIDMKDDEEYELITVRRRNCGVDSRGIFKGKDVLVKTQFALKANQFVISKRQIYHGACGIVPAKLAGAIVSNEYNVFEPVPQKLDIDYFNLFSQTLPMKRAYAINSDGVHIEKLLFKTQSWLKTKVLAPCIEEQKKIVSFINVLDTKINLVAQQIEQTQQFKKGLLQQMFV